MLGFASLEIALAFWMCIAATALCVLYGIVKWNDAGEKSTQRSQSGSQENGR